MADRVIVVHKVAQYERWKARFDAAAGLRTAGGELSFEVLRAVDDGDLVVHTATWSSHEAARAFFESSEVEAVRREAGVEAPTFLYLAVADAGPVP
ncbi:MAG: hypothetical protein JWN17_1898 [Frankiales bacterium]|nr:hypothetical protein [Frankiales bacterium]